MQRDTERYRHREVQRVIERDTDIDKLVPTNTERCRGGQRDIENCREM